MLDMDDATFEFSFDDLVFEVALSDGDKRVPDNHDKLH